MNTFFEEKERAWWNDKWTYRTSVVRPSPWDMDGEVPVEAAVDFPKLLDEAGGKERFDPCSVRVVWPGQNGKKPCEVPAVLREEYDVHSNRKLQYVAWKAKVEAGMAGIYDIYFDVREKGIPQSVSAVEPPPDNIIDNPRFRSDGSGAPGGWELDGDGAVYFRCEGEDAKNVGMCIMRSGKDTTRLQKAAAVRQRLDVRGYAGVPVLFEADLLARTGLLGKPVTVEIEQYREDGSRIMEYAVDPRWLTIELAEGHEVRFSERGRLNPEAAEVVVQFRFWLDVEESCFGKKPDPAELAAEILLDRVLLRPGELWPWPAASDGMFAEGALEKAPFNRSIALTDKRRFAFTGASAGTISKGSLNPDRRSVHWGPVRGTMEFYVKSLWNWDDGLEHLFFEGVSRGRDVNGQQSSLRKCGAEDDNMLTFSIADSSRRVHTVAGRAEFQKGCWHHLAVTWDHPEGRLQLFFDGRKIADESGNAPWPSTDDPLDPEISEGVGIAPGDRRSIPMQLVFGGDLMFERDSARVYMDELRISDIVRYSGDFEPELREYELDEHTRALFHFENTCRGTHYGDDRVIEVFHTHPEQPLRETAPLERIEGGKLYSESVSVAPYARDELFEKNRAGNNTDRKLPETLHPDPRFVEYRPCYCRRIVSDTSEQPALEVKGDLSPLMRWEAFSRAEDDDAGDTKVPRWRANDNVVPFTYESLCNTLAPGVRDDTELAEKVFSYCMDVTRYFNASMIGEEIYGRPLPVRYHLIRMLNIYYSHQCGPLNYPLRKLFILKGISSNDYVGTGHQYQQAHFKGGWRLFDMSKRLYWLDRDNESIIGVRDVHEDPWLMVRDSGNHKAFIPGRPHSARFPDNPQPYFDKAPSLNEYRYPLKPRVPHRIEMKLRGGEKVWMGWHNEGLWMRRNRKGRPLHPGFVPPAYGNGAVSYELVKDGGAANLTNFDFHTTAYGGFLTPAGNGNAELRYSMLCPYVLAGLLINGSWEGVPKGKLSISLSIDGGANFESVWCNDSESGDIDLDISDRIAGRYDYVLRLKADAGCETGRIEGLHIRSPFVCSHLSLPGRLKRGRNRIEMVGGPVEKPVTAELAWTERHLSKLGIQMPGLSYYDPAGDYHRNLLIVKPGERRKLDVELLGRKMSGTVTLEGLPESWLQGPAEIETVKKEGESAGVSFDIQVPDMPEGEMRSFKVRVNDGSVEPRLAEGILLIGRTALVRGAEDAPIKDGNLEIRKDAALHGGAKVQFNGSGKLGFNLKAPEKGRYAAWLRMRRIKDTENALTLRVGDQAGRRINLHLKPCDWGNSERANTKMTSYERNLPDKGTSHWGWYRIADIELDAEAEESMVVEAEEGMELDALAVVPQTEEMGLAMMNLTQNWNFMPWDRPF